MAKRTVIVRDGLRYKKRTQVRSRGGHVPRFSRMVAEAGGIKTAHRHVRRRYRVSRKEKIIETVYVLMSIGTTDLCFVWNAEKNIYADIKLNVGGQASFPCDPADISNWKADQVSVGSNLFSSVNCGRSFVYSVCDFPPWNTNVNTLESFEESSNCGCGLVDTASINCIGDTTAICEPYGPPPPYNRYGGYINTIIEEHIAAFDRHGSVNMSQQLTALNNSDVITNYREEYCRSLDRRDWSSDGIECLNACDNRRRDKTDLTIIQKYHTPIADNIVENICVQAEQWDYCNDIGSKTVENRITNYNKQMSALFSAQIIVQIYSMEIRTVNKNATCGITDWGACVGAGCVGSVCPWQNEAYVASGLKIAAQVGIFENTSGIDPTGLSRNSSFELAITGMYDALRITESIPEDEIANPTIGLSILRGV